MVMIYIARPKMIGLEVKKWHLLTWNPTKWPMDWDDDVARRKVEDGKWSTGSHKNTIDTGDGLFLLMQGSGPRGIIGLGTATSEIWQGGHWNGIKGAEANYVDAEWSEYRSIADRLPNDMLLQEVPGVPWNQIFGSGWQVPDESAARILELWHAFPGNVVMAVDAATPRGAAETPGYVSDAIRNAAIEKHAEEVVKERLEIHGYTVKLVGDQQSWDITAIRDGMELHVEVKGSTQTRSKVGLTKNEVEHSRSHKTFVALAVVDKIAITQSNECSGGRIRVWTEWSAHESRLVATEYDYSLPAGSIADFT